MDVIYAIKWKGVVVGKMSVSQIHQQLSEGTISRMHQISTEDGWMAVDEFLNLVKRSEDYERQQKQASRRLEKTPVVREGALAPSEVPVLRPLLPPLNPDSGNSQQLGMTSWPGQETIDSDGGHSFSSFFHSFTWSNKAVFWVLAAGVLPFLISLVVERGKPELKWIIWLLQGYFSILLAGYFYALSGASIKVFKKGLWILLFTVSVGISLLMVAQQLPGVKDVIAGTESIHLSDGLWGYIAGVGIFEELCKALPLMFFCLGRGRLDTKEMVYLGLMSGLGFAFSEGGLYTFIKAANAVASDITATVEAMEQSANQTQFISKLDKLQPELLRLHLLGVIQHLIRMMSLPILHGAWAGCVGWFIARASVGRAWQNILSGILFAAVVHGIYDVIASAHMGDGVLKDILLMLIAAFSILMLCSLLFGRKSQLMIGDTN